MKPSWKFKIFLLIVCEETKKNHLKSKISYDKREEKLVEAQNSMEITKLKNNFAM